MLRRPLALIALILCFTVLFAGVAPAAESGSLTGKVIESAGTAIEGVEVVILELKREVMTGADGTYAFADIPGGHYTVGFQRLGYAFVSRDITIPMTGSLDVSLERTVLDVPGVEVTATRTPNPALDSPLPSSFLGPRELERETEVSLSHSLERLPGVRTVSTGEQIGKPMIRGLTGSRVLVMDDGHRMEDYSWSDEDGPSVDPVSGERIEVIRGPISVLYGSDALNGVANVLPPELPEAEPGSSVGEAKIAGYFASGTNGFGILAGYEGARGDLGYRININGRAAEAIHTPDGELENTGFNAVTGDAAIGIHGTKGRASLRFARYGGEFKLLEANGPPPGQMEGEEMGPERKSEDNRVQFNGDLMVGSTRLEAKAQYQNHVLIELSDEALMEGEGGAPGSRLERESRGDFRTSAATEDSMEMEAFHLVLNTGTLDLLAHHQLGKRIHGTAGISGITQENDTQGPIALVPDATMTSGAAFLFEEARFGSLSFLAGIRGDTRSLTAKPNEELGIDENEDHDWSEVSGDAGIVFRPTTTLALSFNAGRAWRAPTLFELYAEGPQIADERFLLGRSDLDAEHGLNLDAGIRCQGQNLRGELSAYRNQVDDFIALYPTSEVMEGLPVYRYEQTDAILTGIEAGLEARIVGPLSLSGEVDYVHGQDDKKDEPLPLIPPLRGLVGADLTWNDLSWAERFLVGVDVEAVAEKEKDRLAPSEEDETEGTDSYLLLGAKADLDRPFFGHTFNLSLRVKNATNESYRDFLSRYKRFADNPGIDVTFRIGTTLF